MGPSAIDSEIRSLPTLETSNLLAQFLTAMCHSLETRRNYEVAQAYLGLFLKIHGNEVSQDAELLGLAKKVSDHLRDTWTSLQSNFDSTMCLVSFFMNSVI